MTSRHRMIKKWSCSFFFEIACIGQTAAVSSISTARQKNLLQYGKIRYANPSDEFWNGIYVNVKHFIGKDGIGEINTKLIATMTVTTAAMMMNACRTTEEKKINVKRKEKCACVTGRFSKRNLSHISSFAPLSLCNELFIWWFNEFCEQCQWIKLKSHRMSHESWIGSDGFNCSDSKELGSIKECTEIHGMCTVHCNNLDDTMITMNLFNLYVFFILLWTIFLTRQDQGLNFDGESKCDGK